VFNQIISPLTKKVVGVFVRFSLRRFKLNLFASIKALENHKTWAFGLYTTIGQVYPQRGTAIRR
jgi:hypothetical protein